MSSRILLACVRSGSAASVRPLSVAAVSGASRRAVSTLCASRFPPQQSVSASSVRRAPMPVRSFATATSSVDIDPSAPFDLESSLERLGSGFADSRYDIEDAMESVGSTYYPADVAQAQQSVQATLDHFSAIQDALTSRGREAEALKLRESWSLRLEQLKAELQAAIEAGGADH